MKRALFLAIMVALLGASPALATRVIAPTADWSQLVPGNNPAWDPCAPITWSTPHNGSALERATVRGIRKIAGYSGYTFQRVDSGGQITITFVPADDPMMVQLGAAAYTDYAAFQSRTDGRWWFESATVKISARYDHRYTAYLLPRFVRHELGHAMGLGHSLRPDEVMYFAVRDQRYGAGDRTGLAAVHATTCAPPVSAARGDAGQVHRVVG